MKMLEEEYPDLVEIRYTDNPLQLDEKTGVMPEPEMLDDMNWADIVFAGNILKYGGPYTARVCGVAKQLGKFFHFDTDDLLTELYEEHHLHGVYKDNKLDDITKFCYANADLVTVTQPKFAVRIQPYVRGGLAVIKNVLDYSLPCWNYPKVNPKFTRIGWAAGIHHREDVKVFSRVPHLVNQKVGAENVKWDFYGHPPPGQKKGNWEDNVWNEYKQSLLKGFKGNKNWQIHYALPPDSYGMYVANMDVAIAPLQMNAFNDSKSDIKVAECHSGDTNLLMYSGEVKNIKDIKKGDLLMGPDSKPREVMNTFSGKSKMSIITPKRGKSFRVTPNHTLSLKTNRKDKPSTLEVKVEDLNSLSSRDRYDYMLYRTGVNFQTKEKLTIDPYFVGIMLGDGCVTKTPEIVSEDIEILQSFKENCIAIGSSDTRIVERKASNKAVRYICSEGLKGPTKNIVKSKLFDIGISHKREHKHIPLKFKTANRESRLQLLAGLIDTDGCLLKGRYYQFDNISLQLINDISFVARSLGFYVSEPKKQFKGSSSWYRVSISGATWEIPVRVPRKKAKTYASNRNCLTSQFSVQSSDIEEDYYGIQVNGDSLYLLDDFTVIHNCSRYRIPLIASNVGCYSQTIINGKTGYLIDPDAPTTEWVRILTKVVKDKKHRIELGNNLHEATKDLFDGRKTIKGRYDLYMKAMETTGFKLDAKV